MNEKAPAYIIDLKKNLKEDISGLKSTITKRMDKIDTKIEEIIEKQDSHFEAIGELKVKMTEMEKKQDIHFEAIGELKVQVTGIELSLKDKASHDYVREIEKRTGKLEKVVFV